jgi:hypothetical protein
MPKYNAIRARSFNGGNMSRTKKPNERAKIKRIPIKRRAGMEV